MPLYETSEHLAEEELMKQDYESRHPYTLEKLPIKYSMDYAACCGTKGNVIRYFVEFKRRHKLSTDHPYYLIDCHKVKEAQALWDTFKKPTVLVVKFDDQTGWITLASEDAPMQNYRMIMTSRKDRGDPNDYQPYVMFPVKDFTWFR